VDLDLAVAGLVTSLTAITETFVSALWTQAHC